MLLSRSASFWAKKEKELIHCMSDISIPDLQANAITPFNKLYRYQFLASKQTQTGGLMPWQRYENKLTRGLGQEQRADPFPIAQPSYPESGDPFNLIKGISACRVQPSILSHQTLLALLTSAQSNDEETLWSTINTFIQLFTEQNNIIR